MECIVRSGWITFLEDTSIFRITQYAAIYWSAALYSYYSSLTIYRNNGSTTQIMNGIFFDFVKAFNKAYQRWYAIAHMCDFGIDEKLGLWQYDSFKARNSQPIVITFLEDISWQWNHSRSCTENTTVCSGSVRHAFTHRT